MTGAIGQPSADGDLLSHWLRLAQVRGVGPDTARKLLARFGLPINIFAADADALGEVVSQRIVQALLSPLDDAARKHIDATLQWASLPGNHILTLADADYPASLLQTADPPILLYVKGRVELLHRPSLAVVGSRNASVQGVTNAEKFSEALSEADWTIVSGLALGIDTAAHQGALRHAERGGSTIAVIGTGADIVYPARNRSLAHQVAEAGCIVSEYPLGTPAMSGNFPRRNRIISGLSRGVLVVEAATESGSLITARMAAEQGRDVFAIPGSIHSPLAKGCHLLIKQGAKLVETAQDILEEYSPQSSKPTINDAAPSAPQSDASAASSTDPLLQLMGFDPVDVETLARRTGQDMASLHVQLLTLELQGYIERLPGEVYRRLQ
ncbi:DNA protecting protein DprA [Paucimonas lemoignei]|uniref:DNA protecting protein DprA n=1 Tax=Paucimonas lemoignei TaxID=29443 RepID=A0A4R3HP81_PAULE|nr:DNA-processing protein DprA [Paucimonas lemoignei]TCS32564.1 DNA protecting protein DprA [Paucimonas lemoignei]